MKKILVSGFKPFLQETVNPSEQIVLKLKSEFPELATVVLPVEFGKSFAVLKSEIEKVQPDVVLMLGQASGRKNICLEKVALNWIHSEHRDEAQLQPQTGKIKESQDLALMSSCEVENIYSHLKSQGEPVEISFSAGTYVCNELYFRVLSEAGINAKALFVHVPLLPEQNVMKEKPDMELSKQYSIIKKLIHSLW